MKAELHVACTESSEVVSQIKINDYLKVPKGGEKEKRKVGKGFK